MLILLSSILLPVGTRSYAAEGGRDPVWNIRLKNVPTWLAMVKKPSQLYTEYELPILAGKLILYGDVDPNGCPDGGLNSNNTADRCGMKQAQDLSNLWQNRFNAAILETSQQSGVPPRLLKNIFARESQFWPERVYINTFEYGLGHLTTMGADTTLRWNAPFYDAICAASFSPDTCKEAYIDQPENIRAALMGVVVQRANADCPECKYYLDMSLAERSIPLFADTLLANATFVKRAIQLLTGSQPAGVIAYEDLWKFTLTSYNAGPGCFSNAFGILVANKTPLNWKNLSLQLEPACRGAVPYVDFISDTDSYHPEHDPGLLTTATVDLTQITTPGGVNGTPVFTNTIGTTSTPTVETPSPTTSEPINQTPGTTPTPTVPDIAPTPTPTLLDLTTTVTHTPLDFTPTATPAALDVTPTVTPSLLDITPTITLTALDTTATPTGTFTPTQTATFESTSPTTFTSTPTVEPVDIRASHVRDEIVLKINPRRQREAMQTLQELGLNLRQDVSEIETLNTLVIQVDPNQLTTILAILQASANFIYAEPNYLVSLASLVNDPEFPSQGNLEAVQAPQTWSALPSMQEVLVAVVDTGIAITHPDLADRIWQNAGEVGMDAAGNDRRTNGLDDDANGYIDDWQGWNMISASNDINDTQGHGTHLAGIIAAGVDNSIGIAGVAPNARILPVKVLDDTGFGTYAQVAEGITYATDMGARIINLGFSGAGSSDLLQSAVDYAISHGVLVVAASGNTGSNVINYPAGYPGVVAVSAVDNNGYWAVFSSHGEHISLAAPGVDILSTSAGGLYRMMTGTSQAAAHVSGVAALLVGQPQFYNLDFLRSALLLSARDLGDPGRDPYFGYGMLQAFNALQYAGPVLPTPTPWLVPTATPGGAGGVYAASTLELWGRAQTATYAIANPANSIDSAFNNLVASSSGPYGGSSARRWTFTAIDDNTFTSIAAVYLDVSFYMTGWANDTFYIQVYEPTSPSCVAAGWCTVLTLKINPIPGQPEALVPSSLTTLTVPVTSLLNTTPKIDAAQVRIAGSALTGGITDDVTIYIDEVRLRVLDVLEPTETPTPTPQYIPTATIPAIRAATATPNAGEPHSNFSAISADQCASCHRSHTAQSNALRSLFDEEQACFSCHTSGGSGVNVQPAFTSYTNSLTRFFSHGVSATRNIHLFDEIFGGQFGGASRHVECEDCHSPHLSARSAAGTSNYAPVIQQEMYRNGGVEPIWNASGAPSGFNWITVAEREYEVCFKCHSSYTTLPTYSPDGYGWNGSSSTIGYIPNGLGKLNSTDPAQRLDSRDLAKEFNSYQVSFHPVAAQGRNTNMAAGSFVAPWSQNSIIYCSDCHDNASGDTNGPHGSPLLHILDGSANYITQTDPSRSCAPDGCPSIHSSGELCFKCHQYATYATGSNPVTTTRFKTGLENLHAFHSFGSCYTCHDSHGSEQDRLINFDTSVVSITPGYNSQTAWQFTNGVGTCYIACHDGEHGVDPERQYTP